VSDVTGCGPYQTTVCADTALRPGAGNGYAATGVSTAAISRHCSFSPTTFN